MTEFNTLINNLANPHGKAFSLKKLAIVVSSVLDTTFLIYSVNSLLAGDVKSKTICFLCKLESCCSSAIISLLRTFCAFELYIIILFTYQYTRSNICYFLTENRSTKKMSKRPRRTTTGERRITKGAHGILSTAPFALSTIHFVIIPNDRFCLFNVWRILSVRNQHHIACLQYSVMPREFFKKQSVGHKIVGKNKVSHIPTYVPICQRSGSSVDRATALSSRRRGS